MGIASTLLIQAGNKVEFKSRSEIGQLGHNYLTKKKYIRLNCEQNYKANNTTAKVTVQTDRYCAVAIILPTRFETMDCMLVFMTFVPLQNVHTLI